MGITKRDLLFGLLGAGSAVPMIEFQAIAGGATVMRGLPPLFILLSAAFLTLQLVLTLFIDNKRRAGWITPLVAATAVIPVGYVFSLSSFCVATAVVVLHAATTLIEPIVLPSAALNGGRCISSFLVGQSAAFALAGGIFTFPLLLGVVVVCTVISLKADLSPTAQGGKKNDAVGATDFLSREEQEEQGEPLAKQSDNYEPSVQRQNAVAVSTVAPSTLGALVMAFRRNRRGYLLVALFTFVTYALFPGPFITLQTKKIRNANLEETIYCFIPFTLFGLVGRALGGVRVLRLYADRFASVAAFSRIAFLPALFLIYREEYMNFALAFVTVGLLGLTNGFFYAGLIQSLFAAGKQQEIYLVSKLIVVMNTLAQLAAAIVGYIAISSIQFDTSLEYY